MKKLLLLYLLFSVSIYAQQDSNVTHNAEVPKMQWFKEAKLGIFIHWGIYAVNGIPESWSFYNGTISHEDYLRQADNFTARNYDPQAWADLIAESGARYSVITTKHHDGFALWDSKDGVFNAAKNSPAKKDLIAPFVNALRKRNLKVGLYYSLPDWSYADYTDKTKMEKRYKIAGEPERWRKFQKYSFGQMQELKKEFDPDLWWFDGDWEHTAEEWDVNGIKDLLTDNRPDVIFNSRLNGNGDYETPEIGIPVYKPQAKYWELCVTMNDSWGFQQNDKNYKSSQQIIDLFTDCISKGGNLLLDIGPKADGSIPDEQERILKDLGRWTKKHEEAIFKTDAGIAYEHFNGPTTLSKDHRTLYVFVRDVPKDGKIFLKGITNKIHRVYVVGDGTLLTYKNYYKVYWNAYPGVTYIDIPENVIDENYTVLGVVLDGEVSLFKEKTGAIESN
ncbi:alpha-L-fucosidase [Robertkochia solimangrovi]|uniref:alpha-L-fucosidase n=1 Tax=Robertkochia solimangrovi TaxID=2213046 RepID=UPI00117FDB49|nr:alpha-L-fucosidase [Robertkochia solimangrovi]TRZ46224.1 alpha-L-fucosidase [Robertkochia solimangrovi]